jgi:hypothetical protein
MSAWLSTRRIAGRRVTSAIDAPMSCRPRERRSSIAQALELYDLNGSVWTLPQGLS